MKASLACRTKISFINLNIANNLLFYRFLMNINTATKSIKPGINCVTI